MHQTSPIYLDNAATTAVAPSVIAAMQAQLGGNYANPASAHELGRQAAEYVAEARATVAHSLKAQAAEIVWTSGATEANNLAIKGVADFYERQHRKPGHIITVRTEHKAVIDPVRDLEARGWQVSWLDVDACGRIDLQALQQEIGASTALISVMHVNNETGVIQDISGVADVINQANQSGHAQPQGITFHVDAAQSLGKLEIDVDALGVDLMSLSAHKLHGPKGIGALYVRQRPKARLTPQIHGGGHEQGLRSGTLAPHQIVGFAAACALAEENRAAQQHYIASVRDTLWQTLNELPGVTRNGHSTQTVAGLLNVSFAGVDGEALLAAVNGGEQPLAVSSGSACSAARAESSYVLRALGRDTALAAASLRLSIGRFNTAQEIALAAEKICYEVTRLRALNPLWPHNDSVAA